MKRTIYFRFIPFFAWFLVLSGCGNITEDADAKKIVVCGDHYVFIVDPAASTPDSSAIIWTWDAHKAMDLPESVRHRNFNSIDDCKMYDNGSKMMISSSSSAVAILDVEEKKVLFHAEVPNAHSIEIMPGNRLAAAASTHARGNKLMIFDLETEALIFEDSLYSGHGVVWDHKRNGLFALGYDVLRFYTDGEEGEMILEEEWIIPGESGHDLTMTPDGNHLLMTEHTGAWIFDIDAGAFDKIRGFPDAENIKSLNLHPDGQYLYTVPEESWWTYHVSFFSPDFQLPFPDVKVYKARWF